MRITLASMLITLGLVLGISPLVAIAQEGTPTTTTETATTDQGQGQEQATAASTTTTEGEGASPGAGAQTGQGQPVLNQSFRLEPGGSATIEFEAFCAEFGEDFPAAIEAPNEVAPNEIAAALNYARQQGLTGSDQQALQVQYALWQLLGAQGAPQGDASAQDVVAQAGSAQQSTQDTALIDAISSGQLAATIDSWQPVGQPVQITQGATDNFYGRGTMTVRNTGQQALDLFMPVGTLFPSSDPQEQTMVGYATNIQVNNPQQQATAQPTQQTDQGGGQQTGQGQGGQAQDQGGGQQTGQGQGGQAQGQQRLPQTAVGDSLPLGAIAIFGVLLVGAGLALRRRD